MADEFDPKKLAAAKAANPTDSFDQSKLDSYKRATQAPPPPPPETLLDRASRHIMDAGSGLVTGAQRKPLPPGASLSKRFGNAIGRDAGPVAGMVGAGLASGGASLPLAAGAAALGAMGGEAAQQLGARAAGGEAPKTSTQSVNDIAGEGLKAVAAELGIRAGVKTAAVIKNMIPEAAFAFLKVPVEAVKRAIERPFIVVGGPEAKAMVEKRGIAAIQGLQNALTDFRSAAGKKVSAALESLHAETKGSEIFDHTPVVKNTREYMTKMLQSADPTVRELAGNDIKRIEKVLQTMYSAPKSAAETLTPGIEKDVVSGASLASEGPQANPMRNAKVVNRIKQEIQGLSDYSHRGVPEIQSDLGQDVLKHMGREMRQMIEKTASQISHTGLTKANTEAKQVFDMYDELRPMLRTVARDPYTMMGKLNRLAADFNSGGLRKELVEGLKNVPGAGRHVDDLFDAIAGRTFTEHVKHSESGMIMAMIRTLESPKNLGKSIKLGAQVAKLGEPVKTIGRAGAMMSSPTPNLSQVLGPKDQEKK